MAALFQITLGIAMLTILKWLLFDDDAPATAESAPSPARSPSPAAAPPAIAPRRPFGWLRRGGYLASLLASGLVRPGIPSSSTGDFGRK